MLAEPFLMKRSISLVGHIAVACLFGVACDAVVQQTGQDPGREDDAKPDAQTEPDPPHPPPPPPPPPQDDDDGEPPSPPPAGPPQQPPSACTLVLPVDAEDVSANTDNACRSTRSMAIDNDAAGLDLAPTGELSTYDGRTEAGCIMVDFGSSRLLDPIAIYRRAVPQACNDGAACEGAFCGTGDLMDVFAGNDSDPEDLEFVAQYTVGDRTNYGRQLINLGKATRYIMVCRPGTGVARDDIEIDAITGCEH
ncbi:MAG: hypothetical protein AB7P03_27595 [Kofleriaceae bacterium]